MCITIIDWPGDQPDRYPVMIWPNDDMNQFHIYIIYIYMCVCVYARVDFMASYTYFIHLDHLTLMWHSILCARIVC